MNLRFLIIAALFVLALRPSEAIKFSVTKKFQYNGEVVHVKKGTNCSVAGICTPLETVIPAKTLWYWCGFLVTHKMDYLVKALTANASLSVQLHRERLLLPCLDASLNVSLSKFGSCTGAVELTTCENAKSSCHKDISGMSFPDDICLVVGNNLAVNQAVSIQMNNAYDKARYYGTVFVILFTLSGCTLLLANIAYQLYQAYVEPVGKPHKAFPKKRNLLPGDNDPAVVASLGGDETNGFAKAAKNFSAELAKFGRCHKAQP